MTKRAEITPLPWKITTSSRGITQIVYANDRGKEKVVCRIASLRDRRDVTTEYIVRSCNAMPKMIEAMTAIKKLLDGSEYLVARVDGKCMAMHEEITMGNVFAKAELALAAAKGEE